MPEPFETPREAAQKLAAKILRHLEECGIELDRLAGQACKVAVDRHSLLRLMSARTAEDAGGAQALMGDLVDADANLRMRIEDVATDFLDEIGQDIRAMSSLWDAESTQDKWLSDHYAKNVREMQAEVDVAKARLREHAIGDPKVREVVWAMTNGKCWHCDCELINGGPIANPADRPRLFHVDHLVAKVNGGPDHISNYVPACERCNISKGARSYVEFTRTRRVTIVAVETEPPQVSSK